MNERDTFADRYLSGMILVLFCVLATILAVIVFKNVKPEHEYAFNALAAVAVSIASAMAILVYRYNSSKADRDEEYRRSELAMNECRSLLDKSFDLLTTKSPDHDQVPIPDRLLWLRMARTINSYHKLKESVSEVDHTVILNVHEDDTRTNFSEVLHSGRDGLLTADYFSGASTGASGINAVPLEIASVAVVFGFAWWRDPNDDSITFADPVELFANIGFVGYGGLEGYVRSKRSLWERIERRKAEMSGENLDQWRVV
ncbi:MAG: hypothetical protein AAF270_05825 [Pseudomonadota bacterium]